MLFLDYFFVGILRPHIHLIVPVVCKLISQLQDIGPQTVSWQAKAVATLRRICTSARGAVVEQSLIVVSRTVHCLTRTVTIAHEGTLQYITIRYITIQCSTVQCSRVDFSTIQYSRVDRLSHWIGLDLGHKVHQA